MEKFEFACGLIFGKAIDNFVLEIVFCEVLIYYLFGP